MSSVVLSGDSSGTVTLTVPSAAGTNTATLPAATGTVMVSGNQPAFLAHISNAGNQSISNNTLTKVQLNTEIFDTANAFDSTTNYRFTPQVAGYYQINATIYFTGTVCTNIQNYIYKNGSKYTVVLGANGISVSDFCLTNSVIVYLNGSTDYIELYGYISASSGNAFSGGVAPICTYMSGSLIRAA